MFHKRKAEEKPARERKPRGNLPLIGMDLDDDMDNNEDDGDLEKELAALMGGGGKSKPKQTKKKQVVPAEDLDRMVADCMKDYNDDDLSDTDDPDLLAELDDIQDDSEEEESSEGVAHSFLQTIRDRLSLYKEAEAVALSNGDSSRARRFNRGVKTLLDLERRAVAGGAIREDDIPPVISVGKKKETSSSENTPQSETAPAPLQPAVSPPVSPPKPAATAVSPPKPAVESNPTDNQPAPPLPPRGKHLQWWPEVRYILFCLIVNYSYKSWSNIKPMDSFRICLS